MTNKLISAAVLAALTSTGFAQGGMAGAGNTGMILVDGSGAAGVFTSHAWGSGGSSRGHMYGFDGKVYRSAWTTNGIVTNNLPSTTATTVVTQDTTNLIAGAPYQPVWNNNAMGGAGVHCIDGNPAPAPAPTGNRNWFGIDNIAGTGPAAVSLGWFPTAGNVPMADCYNHPYKPGEYVTVGFAASDQKVQTWSLPSTPGLITPTTVLTLTNACGYDAFIHEDQKLYCWTSTASGPVGFQVVDLVAGTQTFQAVTGISHAGAGYAAVWNEPFEDAGRIAYVLQEAGAADNLFKVDLNTGMATAVTGAVPAGAYNTAREQEEAQLTTWKTGANTRNFHINFGPGAAGDVYFLCPSAAGYASSPLVFDGQEIWLTLDAVSVAAAGGSLGGPTVAPLPASGEIDVSITLPTVGINLYWAAMKIDSNSKLADISNFVVVDV